MGSERGLNSAEFVGKGKGLSKADLDLTLRSGW